MRAFAVVSLALAALASSATADVEQGSGPGPAHAIGPIFLDGSGEVPAQFADKLRAEAQAALETSDVRTVPRDAVLAMLRTLPELATCNSRECVTRFALATTATRVVGVHITVTGELFDIELEIVDEQGRPLRRRSTRCVACTLKDAIARTTAAIRDAAGSERDDDVPVTIRSRPADAKVTIDGVEVGVTPWAGNVVAGQHAIVIAGPRTSERSLFVEAGAAVELAVDIGRARSFGWLTYGAAGVGAAAVIGGIALLSIDGDGTCGQPTCPELYETSAPGWSLTAVGVAALGAAGWMFWHDRQGSHTATVVPTAGGAAAVLGGRF